MDVRVGLWRRLSTKELMLLNCGAGEDSWTEKRSNQSILKEINPEYALEGLMLKLKLQYFGQLMWRALEKTLEMNTHLHECRYEHAFTCIIGKDSDAGEDWRQEKKGATEDEMFGWHHWLNGRESEWTLGFGDGQGGLECCDSWGRKESDATELNWTELRDISSNNLDFCKQMLRRTSKK